MDCNRPEATHVATHVAVRDGLILAVGGPDCAEGWGKTRIDDRFAGKVMLPGLVEADRPGACGPRSAARASGKAPVEMPFR